MSSRALGVGLALLVSAQGWAKPPRPSFLGPICPDTVLANSTTYPLDPAEAKNLDRTLSEPIRIFDGLERSYFLSTEWIYQVASNGSGYLAPLKPGTKPSQVVAAIEILSEEFRTDARPVLFLATGRPQTAAAAQNAKVLSNDLWVETRDPAGTMAEARHAGLRPAEGPQPSPNHLVLTSDSPARSFLGVLALRKRGFNAQPQFLVMPSPLFVPDDPKFPDQWHLRGRGQNGAKKASDAKVVTAWDQRDTSGNPIRGTGVIIAIVDDGVQLDHPDLSNNISSTYRYNWNTQTGGTTNDPSPQLEIDNHGTAVAGVAAARGYNGTGVSGAAPGAQIAPLRFISGPVTDAQEAQMYNFGSGAIRVKNNSWGVGNDSTALTTVGPLSSNALASAAAAGQIILFASGNGLDSGENANFRGRQNSIYVLSVAAANDQGRSTDYSTPGAPVVITAPSGGDIYGYSSSRPQGTSTTDRTGTNGYNVGGLNIYQQPDYGDSDYTENFNGTSSAAPVASGVTALLLQANPSLSWRDAKEIYIRTATRNDPGDADWSRNAAGFWFNHKYGAGLINATEAVRLAKSWSPLGTMTSFATSAPSVPANVRDNNPAGLVRYFDTRGASQPNLRVEHATVTMDLSHPSRGELEIQLTSPGGTVSRLAEAHVSDPDDPADYPGWTFSTVHHWGEDSRGLWKLKIVDTSGGNVGTLNSATLNLYGTAR